MKFSVVVPDLSSLKKSAEKLSSLGYDGIEISIRDPRKVNRKDLIAIVSSYGLEVSDILTGQSFTIDKLSLTDLDKHIRTLAIKRIKDYISLASDFSALVLIGWIRGKWKDNPDRARTFFIEALRECGRFAEDRGISLGIEPLNRYEVDAIYTIDEGIAVIREASLPNLGIIADTFHMNIEESKPIYDAIQSCHEYLFHVHIADSNRKAPGKGHLPFKRFFKTLKETGYKKFVSVEVVPPLPNIETIAEDSMSFLREII